jgi:tetratricopeptide (TPR) repeat protein
MAQSPHLTAALRHVRDGNLDLATDAVTRAELDGVPAQFVLSARGAIEMRRHAWSEAKHYFSAAKEADQDNAQIYNNLGLAQFKLGEWETAAATFRETLHLSNYTMAGAWHKLGACYSLMQQHAEALACLERGVTMAPEDPECHHGMAIICSNLGEEEGALHHYRLAQKFRPGYADAEAGEAFTLLRMGRWLEGWPKFEARWRIPTPVSPWTYQGSPLYLGDLEGLRGKIVLLRSEQGFGDSIQFARYVPLVAEIASEVIVETQSELERLFHVLPASIIVHRRDVVPQFDVQTSLMSLPLLFQTTPETVPPPIKYVSARRDLGVKVGVCWSGGPRPEDPPAHATDARRSLTMEQFSPIIKAVKPCVSLQRESMESLGCLDWQDTADIVGNLDLVVTVDTAMCHLAASLGVRTIMLSRADACWRWGLNTTGTPWYPSMTIYRQPRLGAWRPVIDAVVRSLA